MSGSSPEFKLPDNVKDQSKEMINVLVFGMDIGSHYNNAKEMAQYLQQVKDSNDQYLFNVTVLAFED